MAFIDGGANHFYYNGTNMASTTSGGFRVEDDKRLEIAMALTGLEN